MTKHTRTVNYTQSPCELRNETKRRITCRIRSAVDFRTPDSVTVSDSSMCALRGVEISSALLGLRQLTSDITCETLAHMSEPNVCSRVVTVYFLHIYFLLSFPSAATKLQQSAVLSSSKVLIVLPAALRCLFKQTDLDD